MFPARSNKTRPFLINASGFTLGQLLASLVVITLVAFFRGSCIFIFSSENQKSPFSTCLSNQKQIGLGFLQYIQDYDEKFPLCAQPTKHKGVLSGWAVTHGQDGNPTLLTEASGRTPEENRFALGPLYEFTKSNALFHCPRTPKDSGPLSYMYNDLAAGVPQSGFAAAVTSVLTCDGEDFAGNVGHAYDPNFPAAPATFSSDGTVLLGATLQTATLRHSDGANYGYADGHAKWSKPEAIYFPSRFSASRSHKDAKTGRLLGPAPEQLNTKKAGRFDGTSYVGTFHTE